MPEQPSRPDPTRPPPSRPDLSRTAPPSGGGGHLGRFELEGEIGRGGMGSVLKGRDPSQLRIPLLRGLVDGDLKLVESPLDGSIRPELYDLSADPEERRNLYPRRRGDERVAAMRRRLQLLTADPGTARGAPSLTALGAAA